MAGRGWPEPREGGSGPPTRRGSRTSWRTSSWPPPPTWCRPPAALARPSRRGRAVPAPARGRVIAQLGRLVEANKDALAALVTREIGKPLAESLGEVQEVVDTCDFFLGEGRRLYGQTVPSRDAGQAAVHVPQPGRRRRDRHRSQLPGGRPVLVPGPGPAVRQRGGVEARRVDAGGGRGVHGPVRAAGVPAGVLTTVVADGPTTYEALGTMLAERMVDKVGFTGSSAVGSAIGELCGRHLQSPCLELGGKNPMLVMADADLDLAVEGALFSGFGTSGQRCTSLGTVSGCSARCTTTSASASSRPWRTPSSATRPRPSCTAR